MKISSVLLIGAVLAALSFTTAMANTVSITTINGSGIPDDGYTATTSNGIQLALRARTAYGGTLPNDGLGRYFGTTGFAPTPHEMQANWNWDISVYNPAGLGTADYYVAVDINSTTFYVPLTYPVALYSDNSYGTLATPNGGGVEGPYLAHLGDTVMQNSQSISFLPQSTFLTPLVPGTYTFDLFAVTIGSGIGEPHLNDVRMNVIITAARGVPDNGMTASLLGLGVLGIVGLKKKLVASV